MNQNQTKPDPLGVSMAKLVLAVSFIVGTGALLGVAGYLINMPVKIEQPRPFIEKVENSTVKYLKNCKWQYETSQKDNIGTALNDILKLSEEELREKKYKDYAGKENQWDLSMLIYKHCVWEEGKTLGDNFFRDAKKKEAQEAVKQILEKNFAKDETADWKTYRNEKYGFELKYPSEFLLNITQGYVGPGVPGGEYDDAAIALHYRTSENSYLLSVLIYTKDQWEKFGKKDYSSTFLGENNELIYASETIKSDLADQILSTFKFIKLEK